MTVWLESKSNGALRITLVLAISWKTLLDIHVGASLWVNGRSIPVDSMSSQSKRNGSARAPFAAEYKKRYHCKVDNETISIANVYLCLSLKALSISGRADQVCSLQWVKSRDQIKETASLPTVYTAVTLFLFKQFLRIWCFKLIRVSQIWHTQPVGNKSNLLGVA